MVRHCSSTFLQFCFFIDFILLSKVFFVLSFYTLTSSLYFSTIFKLSSFHLLKNTPTERLSCLMNARLMSLNWILALFVSLQQSLTLLNPIAKILLEHTFSTHNKNAFCCLTACLQFSKIARFLLAKTQAELRRERVSIVLFNFVDLSFITDDDYTSSFFTLCFSSEIKSF